MVGGAPSVEVAVDAHFAKKQIKTQRQMAGQIDNVSLEPIETQWHRRCQSDSGRNKTSRVRVVQCNSFFFNVVKEDIIFKKIRAIDSVYNRTMALELV